MNDRRSYIVVPDISAGEVQKLLRYEPETGRLFWLPRAGVDGFDAQSLSAFSQYVGKEAFTASMSNGYKCGRIRRKTFLAHRVIWAIQTGAWPKEEIDHINMDKGDNRWGNLREATHAQNNQNKPIGAANTSGFKGVSWNNKAQKWQATIKLNTVMTHLGMFNDKTDAALAYQQASREMHGEFGRAS